MPKVFVYGTLKRGYRNNIILMRATFIGTGQTLAKCRLYDCGFPVLRRRLNRDGVWNAPVRGEVYEVNDCETMRRLDSLESEGRMYHRRKKKIILDDGRIVIAHTYVGDARRFARLPIYDPPLTAYEWSTR